MNGHRAMRTNSPIDDPTPFTPPPIPTPPRRKKTDAVKLSEDKKYPEVHAYIEKRKELYRRQLPGGVLFRDMDASARSHFTAIADCVIEELDKFQEKIRAETEHERIQQP